MTESTLSGIVVSGHNLRKGRAVDDDNWAPYVVVALLERNDYDTLLAKQQLDPHSFLYNYQRVYPQRRNTYRTDPPKEESETEIKWQDQDFTFPISTKTEQDILVELWNARPAAPKDELLGEARIGLRSLFVTNGGADGGHKWLTLKKRPVGGNDGGTPGGQILFKFTLNAPKLTYDVDLSMLFPGFQCSVININDYISEEAFEKMGQDKRKRQKVLFEIINTEKTYVRDLYMLNQMFVVRLKEKEILTREEISSIFANIPTLQDMHLELFKTLESLLEKDRSKTEEEIIENGVMNDGLGDIFLSRANLFKHYAAFCSNHINIGVKIKALQAQKPAFAEFLDECFKLPESRGLPIDSFLITPLQRMVKYPLLLDTLIKATSNEHHDYATIKQALLEIKSVVDQVNKRTRQEARVKRMLDLQNQILHGETFNFLDRNRHVVKEGMAKVAGKETYLILFNDVLAFTRKKKDRFDVKAVIQLKGKKWAFLTVVPSFKTAGSSIRKKDMNDPVLVMIPEEDFVDSPVGFPTITVSMSFDSVLSPDSARGAPHDPGYMPSSPRGAVPSPSSASTPSPPSSSPSLVPSPSSAGSSPSPSSPSSSSSSSGSTPPPSSTSAATPAPSPPSFTKAASSGNLPMAASPPLTPHTTTQSASLPAVSVTTLSPSTPSTKNLPEISSNSNQFAEGGIYKFFFKTVEERNEWMLRFRKVAGRTAAAPAPSVAPLTPSAAPITPPPAEAKKSLTEIVKQKHESRRGSRTRSISASVTLPKPDAAATAPPPSSPSSSSSSSSSPPPSAAGSPSAPLIRVDTAKAAAGGENAESPPSADLASTSAALAAATEREAALQQTVNERNTEIAELKKKLEHEEALRKEVQLTCQTLQKKIVDSEKDKAEKIKSETEKSEFLRAEVMKKLHDIEKELAEEREERKHERERRHRLEEKLDKMWDSILEAVNSSNRNSVGSSNGGGSDIMVKKDGSNHPRPLGSSSSSRAEDRLQLSFKVDKNADQDENSDLKTKAKSESGGSGGAVPMENEVLSPRAARRRKEKDEKKKEKERAKEKEREGATKSSDGLGSSSGSGKKKASTKTKSVDTESEGSDMSGSGSEITTSAGKKGNRGSTGAISPSSGRDNKKSQWRMSIWWGNKTAAAAAASSKSNPTTPVKSSGGGAKGSSNASHESLPRRDSELDSEGSEKDESRDVKRKQVERTASWRAKAKNTASLPRTLSHGSMEKVEVKKNKERKGDAKANEKERKEEEKKLKESNKKKAKEQGSTKKKGSSVKSAAVNSVVDTNEDPTDSVGNETGRSKRSNSLPSAASPRADAGLEEEPALDDNQFEDEDEDEQLEEWEMESNGSPDNKKKNKKKKEKKEKEDKEDEDEDDEEEEDEEEDEKEEEEKEETKDKPSKKSKKTKTKKKSKKENSSSDEEDGNNDKEDEQGNANNGDDLLVGSPRKKGGSKLKKASSLSRSAGSVATQKIAKEEA